MSYQYYNTLLDKSKKAISSLLENIVPKLDREEFRIILSDYNVLTSAKKSKTKTNELDKIVIFKDSDDKKNIDFSKLSEKELEVLYKTYISKELTDRTAVKWRFYQNLKIMKEFDVKEIILNPYNSLKGIIDFSILTQDDETLLISCFDILDLDQYNNNLNQIVEYLKKNPKNVSRLLLATNRSYRNIPLNKFFDIGEKILVPEIWVEWIEENRPFNSDDLLIANNNELTMAGFNFTGMQDLLDYVYKMSQGGQISMYKSAGYFSENFQEENEIELFWKGIMLKGEKLNDSFNLN